MLAAVDDLSDNHYGKNRDGPFSPPSRLVTRRQQEKIKPQLQKLPLLKPGSSAPTNNTSKASTKKKWSPIKFPQDGPKVIVIAESLTQKKTVHDRLSPPIDPGHPTTPRSSRPSSCPPARRNLLSTVDPWMNGCDPNAFEQRHQNDQAPFGTDPNARPWARPLWLSSNDDE